MSKQPEVAMRIAYDAEAGVWYVFAHSGLDGLYVEAKTLDELLAELPDAICELIGIIIDD